MKTRFYFIHAEAESVDVVQLHKENLERVPTGPNNSGFVHTAPCLHCTALWPASPGQYLSLFTYNCSHGSKAQSTITQTRACVVFFPLCFDRFELFSCCLKTYLNSWFYRFGEWTACFLSLKILVMTAQTSILSGAFRSVWLTFHHLDGYICNLLTWTNATFLCFNIAQWVTPPWLCLLHTDIFLTSGHHAEVWFYFHMRLIRVIIATEGILNV